MANLYKTTADLCMGLRYLKDDIIATVGNRGSLQKMKWILASHTLHLTILIRTGQSCLSIPVIGGGLRWLFELMIRVIYASDISLKAYIGPGLSIQHGHDIVIGADVIIGKKCKIFNGVTLGNKDTETSINQQPRIGDNVVLGTGAKILGKIAIGNNVKVGANSVVLHNIPDNAIAVGMPARYKIQDTSK